MSCPGRCAFHASGSKPSARWEREAQLETSAGVLFASCADGCGCGAPRPTCLVDGGAVENNAAG